MNLTFGCYVKKKPGKSTQSGQKTFFYIVSTQLDILSYYDQDKAT